MIISSEFIQTEEPTQVSPIKSPLAEGQFCHRASKSQATVWKDLICFYTTCGIKKGLCHFFNGWKRKKWVQISHNENVWAHCHPHLLVFCLGLLSSGNSRIVLVESVWPTEMKIFIIWPLQKVCASLKLKAIAGFAEGYPTALRFSATVSATSQTQILKQALIPVQIKDTPPRAVIQPTRSSRSWNSSHVYHFFN